MQQRVGVRGAPGAAAAGPGSGGGAAGLGARFTLHWERLWAQAVLEVEHGPRSDETQAGPLLLLPCTCAYMSRGCPSTGLWPLGCGRVGWTSAEHVLSCWTLRARCSPGARAGMDSWTTGPWRQSREAEAVRSATGPTHG